MLDTVARKSRHPPELEIKVSGEELGSHVDFTVWTNGPEVNLDARDKVEPWDAIGAMMTIRMARGLARALDEAADHVEAWCHRVGAPVR